MIYESMHCPAGLRSQRWNTTSSNLRTLIGRRGCINGSIHGKEEERMEQVDAHVQHDSHPGDALLVYSSLYLKLCATQPSFLLSVIRDGELRFTTQYIAGLFAADVGGNDHRRLFYGRDAL